MFGLLRRIPLYAFLLALYNLLLLSRAAAVDPLTQTVFQFSLRGGTPLAPTVGDVLIMAGVVSLYIEIFKATRTSAASILDHLFSMVVFVVFLVEFLLVDFCATVPFLTLTMMSFLDVVAGFTVTISTARRDLGLGGGTGE
ncbi:MAG: hypothetical protein HQL82_01985 [Magnetococcales bacterium]|nr:hypothetical protein [Magnetococcales bacterium]